MSENRTDLFDFILAFYHLFNSAAGAGYTI